MLVFYLNVVDEQNESYVRHVLLSLFENVS